MDLILWRDFLLETRNYVPSLFTAVFVGALYFLKEEFHEENGHLRFALLTGIALSLQLLLNTGVFYNWFDPFLILKIHLASTSLITVLMILLTNRFFELYQANFLLALPILTLVLSFVLGFFNSGEDYATVVLAIMPNAFTTSFYSLKTLWKLISKKQLKGDLSVRPLMITGFLTLLVCLMDTYLVIKFQDRSPVVNGYGLLLYYIVLILTYIIRHKKIRISELALEEKVAMISRQVAHDIKSPMATLKIALTDLTDLPSALKHLIKSSLNRMESIIYDLEAPSRKLSSEKSNLMINTVVDNVILESLIRSQEKQIKIINQTQTAHQGYFCYIDRSIFERVLTNLINNALEASSKSASIEIKVEIDQSLSFISISIQDHGVGIPEAYLTKVFEKNFSYNKVTGTGLGLTFAQEKIEAWGGKLKLESVVNVGTIVIFTIPLSTPPLWFSPYIDLTGIKQVIVVDDDPSWELIWRNKVGPVPILFYNSLQKFQNEWDSLRDTMDKKDHLIVLDQDFRGEVLQGTALLSQFKNSRVILLTSRFDDEEIKESARFNKVKLMAKEQFSQTPVFNHFIHVIIDDDELFVQALTLLWQANNKQVESYKGLPAQASQSKTKVYFIDYELGEMKGEEIALSLYQRGERFIYLMTGHENLELKYKGIYLGIISKAIIKDLA